MTQKMTQTFVRSPETMKEYMDIMNYRKENGIKYNPFVTYEKTKIKEFNHWIILQNEFPYDAIANVSHMIATKREVPFDWKLLKNEEKQELETIKNEYLSKKYDVIWENLPKGQTVPGHFHLHLLVLKREEI